jgi:nucleotide-binding universal stress UspA family protein
MKVDKVLVPLDGSPLAEMALPTAIELLRDSPDATLVLLRAAEVTTLPGVDPTDAQVAVVREAEEYLEGVATRLRNEGRPRVITSVWFSRAAEAIVEAARVRGVDLIVMSTQGRSGLRRIVFGSVAESVLRGTQTPILLVSAAGARVDARRRRSAADSPGSEHSCAETPGARSSSWDCGKAVARHRALPWDRKVVQ